MQHLCAWHDARHGMLLSLHEYVCILSSHRRRIARGEVTQHECGE